MATYSKAQKIEALKALVDEVERRAVVSCTRFSRQALSGRKRDFLLLARSLVPELAGVSEGSLEEYMRSLGYKFPHVSIGNVDAGYYKRLFPELILSSEIPAVK